MFCVLLSIDIEQMAMLIKIEMLCQCNYIEMSAFQVIVEIDFPKQKYPTNLM